MVKFAFIINVPGASPETYSAVYETAESHSTIVGVDGVEAGKEYAKKLAAEGIDIINLCGDFDDEITDEIIDEVGEGIKVRHADYSIDELAKLNQIQSFKYYGIIVQIAGVEEPHTLVLEDDECVATVIFVKDMAQAKKAAVTLVKRNNDFMELCSWFDRLKMEEIVDAIEDAIPVGTCGDLDMTEI